MTRKPRAKQKAICIKFSDRNPRDVALWERLREQIEKGDVNLSAAIKELLYGWCIQGQPIYSIPSFAADGAISAHAAEVMDDGTREDPNDPLVNGSEIRFLAWESL